MPPAEECMAVVPAPRYEFAAVPAGDDLSLLKLRDAAAWSGLFEREYPFVFRVVLGRVCERAAAEDIAGQVFLEALEGIGRYRDRGKPIRAWLVTIARHRTHDWFRKQRRQGPELAEATVPGPDAGLSPVLDMLARLTPEQREVVHLRFVEGYSLEEVAGLTGRRVGAVKALQHRAIVRLRTILASDPEVLS